MGTKQVLATLDGHGGLIPTPEGNEPIVVTKESLERIALEVARDIHVKLAIHFNVSLGPALAVEDGEVVAHKEMEPGGGNPLWPEQSSGGESFFGWCMGSGPNGKTWSGPDRATREGARSDIAEYRSRNQDVKEADCHVSKSRK